MKIRWTPIRWTIVLLGLTVTLGAGTMAAVVAQPDLLRPLVKVGIPISAMTKLPFLGDAALAAEADQITPIELKQLLADTQKSAQTEVLLLDVRTPAEFQRGHLPGAILIPISQIESGEGLEQIRSQLAIHPSAQLITYCHSGARSHRALGKLRQMGIQGMNLKGGIVAWRNQVDPTLPEPKP